MANITINTQSQQYQRTLARFRELKASLIPRMRLYFQLDEIKQRQWRQRDPLLSEILDLARKIERGKSDL